MMTWQTFLVWLYSQQGKNFVLLMAGADLVTFVTWLSMYTAKTRSRYEELCSPHWTAEHCKYIAGEEASSSLGSIFIPALAFAAVYVYIYFFYHDRRTLVFFTRAMYMHAYILVLWMVMTIVQQSMWFPFLLQLALLVLNVFLIHRLSKLPLTMFGADGERGRNSMDEGSREMTNLN